jgi:predicted nucleic acid-binding protein
LQTRYVVDATIIVSWLLDPNKLTGKIVRSLELELFTPYLAVSELWKHTEYWSRRRPSLELQQFTDAIGYCIRIIPTEQYCKRWTRLLR